VTEITFTDKTRTLLAQVLDPQRRRHLFPLHHPPHSLSRQNLSMSYLKIHPILLQRCHRDHSPRQCILHLPLLSCFPHSIIRDWIRRNRLDTSLHHLPCACPHSTRRSYRHQVPRAQYGPLIKWKVMAMTSLLRSVSVSRSSLLGNTIPNKIGSTCTLCVILLWSIS